MSEARPTTRWSADYGNVILAAAGCGAVCLLAACGDLTPPPSTSGRVLLPQVSGTVGDTTGLVAYWNLDERTGASSFADSSGSGITGSCTGSTCPTLGVWGKEATAAQFSRANSQTITFGTPAQLDFGTSSFSYGFWAKVPGIPDSSVGSEVVWYKGGNTDTDTGFALDISALGGGWFASISDGVIRRNVFGWTIYPNQWTHLMAVVDRTAGTLTLYQDGSAVGTTALDSLGSVTSRKAAVLSCGPYGYCFDGTVDEVRIYNRALTAAEVRSLYAAYGKDYYVAPQDASPPGNDSNPCTATAPCYTMMRVGQLMSPGATAHFRSGTYYWDTSQRVDSSGTAGARVTYISDTPWGAKIISSSSGGYIIGNTGDYVDIMGFDLTADPLQNTVQNGIVQGDGIHGNFGRIIGNRVHDLPMPANDPMYGGAAIGVSCCSPNRNHDNQVIGNVVDNIAPSWASRNTYHFHGIYVAGPADIVENNLVTRVADACIQTYHRTTHEIVSNNLVAGCRFGITISADPADTTNDSTTVDNNIIVNNTIGLNEGYSLGADSNIVAYNNIFYNNGQHFGGDGCCVVHTSGSIFLTDAQFNALFVNYTGDMTGNYHLKSGAVAIDAGTTSCAAGVILCVPATDFDGYARPHNGVYDIGAYEWHP